MSFILIVKLTVLASCAVCKFFGEIFWHNAQRWIMPAIMGVGVSIITGCWWLLPCVYLCCIPIDLGYKVYGPSDGFDRTMWLGIACVVAGIGCVMLHHLAWYFYAAYCIIGFVWGGVSRTWWNVIIAPISGLLIGSLICLVH